jgi:hypothetical protein
MHHLHAGWNELVIIFAAPGIERAKSLPPRMLSDAVLAGRMRLMLRLCGCIEGLEKLGRKRRRLTPVRSSRRL